MTQLILNNDVDLEQLERYKSLPYAVQNEIGLFVDEAQNMIANEDYDWHDVINTIGTRYFNGGFHWLIGYLNEHLSDPEKVKNQLHDCQSRPGYSHTCNHFITCQDMRESGFYYDYGSRKGTFWWEEDGVDSELATNLILNKIDEYIVSERYDPALMCKINKYLLDVYESKNV